MIVAAPVNRNLLTQAQNEEYDAWLDFFASRGWQLYQERFGKFAPEYDEQLKVVQELNALGRLQGASMMLNNLLDVVESAVTAEFQLLSTDRAASEQDRPDDLVILEDPQA